MIQTLMIMVGFVGILCIVAYYIARHLQQAGVGGSLLRWSIGIVVGLIGSLMVMAWSNHHTTTIATVVYRVTGLVVPILTYLVCALLIVDLVSLISPISGVGRLVVAGMTSLIVTTYGVWNSFQIRIVEEEFALPGLQETTTALHLTDTHFGHARGLAQARVIVDRIRELQPDVVFFTGDMFDSQVAVQDEIFEVFGQLTMPVYFIEGNHDVDVAIQPIKQGMKDNGVIVLENDIAEFGDLQILGLDYMRADENTRSRHQTVTDQTIQQVMEQVQRDPSKPSIVLHHSPDGVEYIQQAGANLFLAGHTHAGQLFPYTLVAKAMFGYNRGRYQLREMDIYVCSGTGTFGPVVRVATRSEMCLLKLVPQEGE